MVCIKLMKIPSVSFFSSNDYPNIIDNLRVYRQEKKVDDYGVLQRHFYFYYFPAWAAKNYPNKQSHEDFL